MTAAIRNLALILAFILTMLDLDSAPGFVLMCLVVAIAAIAHLVNADNSPP